MNFVVCDDDPRFAEGFARRVRDLCAEHNWECCCQCADGQALLQMDFSAIDALFLDIEMPGINGLDIAGQLRSKYQNLILVFVTGFIEYAPSGYKVQAFRYLLKPKVDQELPECLEDIHQKLYADQALIPFKTPSGEMRVRLSDIVYLEGTHKRCTLAHLDQMGKPACIQCSGTLASYESQLDHKGFLKIQRSYFVNMRYIQKMANYQVILKTSETLKMSRLHFSENRQRFLLWKGEHL